MNDTDDVLSGVEEEEAEISIPREVLESLGNGESVRMASLLFRNMSGLLPEMLEGADNDGLVCVKFEGSIHMHTWHTCSQKLR